MKWKDLSLKERKQIYDSVRANNPDATYLDIKQQFDSIPAYQDGKGKTINKADLPPEYRTGTPEYFERQRKISGMENLYPVYPIPSYKDGGIHIKKKNRGKFTAAAKRAGMGVQAYAKKVLKDPNASPTLKKRANFARNFGGRKRK